MAIEVLSPNDRMTKVNRCIGRVITRGVPLVWLIDPEEQTVTVYRPDGAAVVLERDDELTGGDILPDFRCPVADFFVMPEETNQNAGSTSAYIVSKSSLTKAIRNFVDRYLVDMASRCRFEGSVRR